MHIFSNLIFPERTVRLINNLNMTFVFLNTTGRPELSEADAKRMRGHITRTNFAIRRQRIINEYKTRMASEGGQHEVALSLPLTTPPRDRSRYAQFLTRFWSLVFLGGAAYPSSRDEEAFIKLLVSEAAFAEVSLAVGMQYWSPDASCQQKAVAHSCKATNLVVQRIQSGSAHTVPVLGAVLSMAVAERLAHNHVTWNMHVNGLANIIAEGYARGEREPPEVICHFLTIDSVNHLFGFPLVYHSKVIDAIRPYGNQPVLKVAGIIDGFVQLQDLIAVHHNKSSTGGSELDVGHAAKEIKRKWTTLLYLTRALRREDNNPFAQAVSRSIELALHLSWPSPSGTSRLDLTPLAGELKQALCQIPVRPCLFMDITSCQLMLGAIAAAEDSEVRAWFVAKMKRAAVALRSRGCVRPLDILEKGFVSDVPLVARFRELWKELYDY
ncbi:hypothetical protein B0T19DRAFT_419970 [Cercophora scortea]|uniref:Uncharacterized protein n=1 Tax=Cercophora scortea TaxID=314031 RepID=A0AAE0MJK6_9PEZI|nr:hypothetical protein B0T19DRAFT_419970 [Cercophora scortea]